MDATLDPKTEVNLAVAVYLDNDVMLDLLASIDGGFSTVERVTSHSTDSSERTSGVSADLGVSGLLSNVVRLGFGGSTKSTQTGTVGDNREGDRYYTAGSLLHKLRHRMSSEDLIHRLGPDPDDWARLSPSDFVEFRGEFSPNPLAHAIRMFLRLTDLAKKAGVPATTEPATHSTSRPSKPRGKVPTPETGVPTTFLETFLADLEHGKARLLVIKPTIDTPYSVVTTINSNHLRDESLQELLDGEYRILGQVTRHLPQDAVRSINLLRASVFGVLAEEQVTETVDMLNTKIKAERLRIPPTTSVITPPALQILPIAIYP